MATRGLVNLGPSAHERQEARFEAAVQAVLRGNYKVGVLGKGGVGKTTVAASVGSIFAELRRQDRVVAVDADTAFGRLASRIDPRTESSYWELAADKNLRSFADVRAGSAPTPPGCTCWPATRPPGVVGCSTRPFTARPRCDWTVISPSPSSTAGRRWTHRSLRRRCATWMR
ncbi:cobQ/CobB/MinD/ParA nucleotide binding domain protein [Mycobacterium xenopi 4042]|uniref:CobQ/CobB/MinD/ParA nucleotide binding domain protein n=1 Tax=Mycobacterium xenopi 4042 TaxID=1299334 RepID=X8CLP0_MYCXE|nr:cobQ/CobB/MinD/ParA nucleotide binding domain protein [Mycobacterium xenopi 4042]